MVVQKASGEAESEETLREQLQDSQRRVQLLARKLAAKDRDLALCTQQVEQLRSQVASQSLNQLRSCSVDPAVGATFRRLRREMTDCKATLEQTQSDLSAWKFTPDSQTGKRLMARIRQLQQENSELTQGVSCGSVARLECEIAIEKLLLQHMRKTQSDQEQLLSEQDGETESLQATVVQLQSQLRDAYSRIESLERRLCTAAPAQSASSLATGYSTPAPAAAAVAADAKSNGAAQLQQQQQQQ